MDRSKASRWFAQLGLLSLAPPLLLLLGSPAVGQDAMTIRVATFNVWDIRTSDLRRDDQPRVGAIAETLQRLRPNIVLINEIAYDQPGAPGSIDAETPGGNAQRFIKNYLAKAQVEGAEPLRYKAFMAPVNTGIPSGFDLDNDGKIVTSFPMPAPSKPDGTPGEQSDRGRAYGNDCWGFGTFPGQYGMALLVDERLEILEDQIRTFRLFPWDYLPGAMLPTNADAEPWFTEEERRYVRLSSKSHWDVPVRLPNGAVIHMLCSHPTPPAFDGPEQRNQKRNHDEIRFWRDYVSGASSIVDDKGKPGGMRSGELFVILGDLNADAEEGTAVGNPVKDLLFANRRIKTVPAPKLDPPPRDDEKLDATDTASFGKRADYIIPSSNLEVVRSGIWRSSPTLWPKGFPSDHFPVWMELRISPGRRVGAGSG